MDDTAANDTTANDAVPASAGPLPSLPAYRERWRANLIARNGIDVTSLKGRADLDEWMGTLEAIHADFTHEGANHEMVADRKFQSMLDNGTGYQPDQVLGEMLFFDWLRRNGFEAIPTNGRSNGVGPDFQAVKDGIKVWFELVSPEPDRAGFIAGDFSDGQARLNPTPERNDALRKALLMRVTAKIAAKRDAFAGYLANKRVGPDDPCVIVVNDALLCPPDLPFGITHGAESAMGSGRPLIAHAVLSGGYSYLEPVPGEPDLWRRGPPTDSLLNANGAPVMLNDFQSGAARHVSAIMQVTLREEYAVARQLDRIAREKNLALPIPLRAPNFVMNPQATNPFPLERFGYRVI